MKCIECNYFNSWVVSTDNNENRNIIKRRRECLKCSSRFTTHERYADNTGLNRKSNNNNINTVKEINGIADYSA